MPPKKAGQRDSGHAGRPPESPLSIPGQPGIPAADTIAAIATPPGAGGIGIVRISGPQAQAILLRIFSPARPEARLVSHRLVHGWIRDPESDSILDEALAVVMRAPHSYTRDDVAEIHCHASFLILQQALGLVLRQGARLAGPGEFTKRAFLNGRIDLTRAEAVLDVLSASTREGLDLALGQLQGRLFEAIQAVAEAAMAMRARIEVAIDFPEEDAEILQADELRQTLAQAIVFPLDRLIQAHERGRLFRDGLAVVIVGRPNVGKSSLLNALLREERAIVTPIPGTTRDTIEETVNLRGIPMRIVDTAGIRQHAGAVEELGIQRARRVMAEADLALLVVDGSRPPSEEDLELRRAIAAKPCLVVANKDDLAADKARIQARHAFPDLPVVPLSAREQTGIEELEEAIFHLATGGAARPDPGHAIVPNLRQRQAIGQAREAAGRLAVLLAAPAPQPDLLAIELQDLLDSLGDLVGRTTPEDVLDRIFEAFCIGK